MVLREPATIEECIYFTNRSIGKGKVKAWVNKTKCPTCQKGIMGKPRDPKTGKPKIRAKEYICAECGFTIEGKAYEEALTASIMYTCPHCLHQGEIEFPFKRKKVKIKAEEIDTEKVGKEKTVDSLRFNCQKCGKSIDITKKMK